MTIKSKILMAVLVVLVAIQFIQPSRNQNEGVLPSDISHIIDVPQKIKMLLRKACYDCHSNNTNYPWYSSLQPVGWIIANDIKEGKEKINFSEWGILSFRKQKSRLREIRNIINEGKMPLTSYKLMHKDARLSNSEEQLIIDWINKIID